MNKEFKQEIFKLNLKRYLNLAKEKLWRSIVFSSITFVCFLGLIICFSILTVTLKKDSTISKLEIGIYIIIVPCLISLTFVVWWSRFLLYTNKLRKNLSQIRDWSLWKKRKYFAIFILIAKIHFSPNNIKETIQNAKLSFQKYHQTEANAGDYSFVSPLKMEMWWMFFDEFVIFHLFLVIIYALPMLWTQLKYRYQIGLFWIKDDENVKKNFSLLMNNFFDALGMDNAN